MTKEKKKTKTETTIAKAKPEVRIGTRGKVFEGIVKKKFHKRVVIEFERMVYVRKYERYARSRTKIHARLLDLMQKEINIGDLIRIQECRPLSKIIHFIVVKKLKNADEVNK